MINAPQKPTHPARRSEPLPGVEPRCLAAAEVGNAPAPPEVLGLPRERASLWLPADLLEEPESIILLLKPSLLHILLWSLGSLAAIGSLAVLLAYLSKLSAPWATWSEQDAFTFGGVLAVVRLGWQAADWWGRTYVLTDRRIIAMQGIIRRSLFQSSLSHIQHLAVVQSARERCVSRGTIAFATAGSDRYDAAWMTLTRPYAVYRKVTQTIDRYGHRNNGSL